MRLNDHRYFIEVATCGGIRKAAEKLNVASSAISRHIAELEATLGMPLFERKARGMVPTRAGELYLRYARDLVLGEAKLLAEFSALKGLQQGHVCISSTEGHGADFMTHAIVTFRTRYPGITFDLMISNTKSTLTSIQDGRADIGVVFMPEPSKAIASAFSIRAPILAVMTPNHPLAGRASLSLQETLAYPIALPEKGFGIRNLLESISRAGGCALEPALSTNSNSAMKNFARHAGAIAFLTRASINLESTLGVLTGIPLTEAALNQTSMEVCVLGDRRLPPAVRAFLKHIKAEASATGSRLGQRKAPERA